MKSGQGLAEKRPKSGENSTGSDDVADDNRSHGEG